MASMLLLFFFLSYFRAAARKRSLWNLFFFFFFFSLSHPRTQLREPTFNVVSLSSPGWNLRVRDPQASRIGAKDKFANLPCLLAPVSSRAIEIWDISVKRDD